MGKQKPTIEHTHKDQYPRSSSKFTDIRCSSDMELLSDEKHSHSSNHGVLPLPAGVLDITDGSIKLLNTHQAMTHHQHHHHHHHHHHHQHQHQHQHHQSLSRSIYLKRSRYYYGNQYSRRYSANHANASSSRGKSTSSFDEKLPEYKEKTFSKPERIRSSSYDVDSVSEDVGKMVCGICQKQLRRKFNFFGNSMSCNELTVVSVLVCGHVYHADCLEQRTSLEEQRDPSCPVCADLHLQAHNSKEQ